MLKEVSRPGAVKTRFFLRFYRFFFKKKVFCRTPVSSSSCQAAFTDSITFLFIICTSSIHFFLHNKELTELKSPSFSNEYLLEASEKRISVISIQLSFLFMETEKRPGSFS